MTLPSALTIDARCLAGGVGTYALNLVRELRSQAPWLPFQVLTAPTAAGAFTPMCDRVRTVSAPVHSIREQFEMALAVGSDTLLHCTHYNAPLLRRGPLVVTIPDITPLLGSAYHNSNKSRFLAAAALAAMARRADHIITVSDYSRACMIEKLRVSAGKITVAYNGVNEVYRPMNPGSARKMCAERLGIQSPFILYVGLLRPHKNVGTLLRAYQLCRELYGSDHRLLIVGEGEEKMVRGLRRLARDLRISDFTSFAPYVEETTLVAAYNAAAAVVVPSLEEGFCLPLVEAMACGTPVACSDTSALPEIAGDSAAYFDPRNPVNIADIVQTVLERTDLRRYMRARGLAVAARYRWAESARVHLGVYAQFMDTCSDFPPCNQMGQTGSESVPLAHATPTRHA